MQTVDPNFSLNYLSLWTPTAWAVLQQTRRVTRGSRRRSHSPSSSSLSSRRASFLSRRSWRSISALMRCDSFSSADKQQQLAMTSPSRTWTLRLIGGLDSLRSRARVWKREASARRGRFPGKNSSAPRLSPLSESGAWWVGLGGLNPEPRDAQLLPASGSRNGNFLCAKRRWVPRLGQASALSLGF